MSIRQAAFIFDSIENVESSMFLSFHVFVSQISPGVGPLGRQSQVECSFQLHLVARGDGNLSIEVPKKEEAVENSAQYDTAWAAVLVGRDHREAGNIPPDSGDPLLFRDLWTSVSFDSTLVVVVEQITLPVTCHPY